MALLIVKLKVHISTTFSRHTKLGQNLPILIKSSRDKDTIA